MARRLSMMTALVVAWLVAAGCAGKAPAPPAQPVHVPEITQEQTVTAPSPAPSAKPEKPSYPDPAPAISYPPGPPAVAKPAEFMPWVEQTAWNPKSVQGLFPATEATYRKGSGEEPSWVEYAYDGGALRLFAGGDGLFAVVVAAKRPGYESFRNLKSGTGYQIEQTENFTVILKLADAETQKKADAVRGAKHVDLTTLESVIGRVTFSFHHHGVGSYSHYYVPAGLSFVAYDKKDAEASKDSGTMVRQKVAGSLASDVAAFYLEPGNGRLSPGGKWWAGKVEFGGYWNNWIVVRTAGKAEQRYQAIYFIDDFFWLDDHRIVYGEMMNADLVVIDVNSRTTERISTPGRREFGIAGPGKIWYTTEKGTRHEVAIP